MIAKSAPFLLISHLESQALFHCFFRSYFRLLDMSILPSKMASIKAALFTAALFATTAQGHMIMANPVPYGYQSIDNSPLSSDGSNYPCKVTSDPATFYSTSGIDNTYAAGSSQSLSFKGSAVHGGGSCQLAITSDMQPSAETDWRVIMSIESGCPSTDGTNPSTYNWTVPEDLAPGQYSFAWTWISKLAGQPEYYMNCAPITVTAGSSKKRETTAASSYPALFVANLNSINSCKTSPGTDPVFPDPGDNVAKLLTGATPSFASISAAGCVPLSQTQGLAALPTATAGGSGGSGAASSAGSATTSAAAASSSATSSSANAASGGIFVTTPTKAGSTLITSTVPSSTETISVYVSPITPTPVLTKASSTTPASQATTTSSSSAQESSATSDIKSSTTTSSSSTVESSTTTPSSSVIESSTTATSSAAQPTVTGSGSGSGSSNSTGSSGSASTKSGACTDEGMFNCVGSQYQQCASGSWTAMQALPAGTSCTQGESTGLWARDARNMLRRIRRGRMSSPAGY